MSRITTMARFAEPEDVTPVTECEVCGAELYEGDTVYKAGHVIFCCSSCVADAYCEEETLYKDDYCEKER